MSEITAKPTWYKGVQFKSRLEARWAVFFDEMGIKYIYEPRPVQLKYGIRYLPDFLLTNVVVRGDNSGFIYAEVKGRDRYDDIPYIERAKIEAFAEYEKIIILGNIPEEVYKCFNDHFSDGMFNYRFIDGDSYPCFFSKHNGNIWLCGPDHNEFDKRASMRALSYAKLANFEKEEGVINL